MPDPRKTSLRPEPASEHLNEVQVQRPDNRGYVLPIRAATHQPSGHYTWRRALVIGPNGFQDAPAPRLVRLDRQQRRVHRDMWDPEARRVLLQGAEPLVSGIIVQCLVGHRRRQCRLGICREGTEPLTPSRHDSRVGTRSFPAGSGVRSAGLSAMSSGGTRAMTHHPKHCFAVRAHARAERPPLALPADAVNPMRRSQ